MKDNEEIKSLRFFVNMFLYMAYAGVTKFFLGERFVNNLNEVIYNIFIYFWINIKFV